MTDNDNVVQFSAASDDPFHCTPLQLLKEAIHDIESGKLWEPTSALLLFYRKGDDERLDTYRYCSKLKTSDEIVMLESFKFMALSRFCGFEDE